MIQEAQSPTDSLNGREDSQKQLLQVRQNIYLTVPRRSTSPRKISVHRDNSPPKKTSILNPEVVEAVRIQTRRLRSEMVKKAVQLFMRNTQTGAELRQLIDDQATSYVIESTHSRKKAKLGIGSSDQIESNYKQLRHEYKIQGNLSANLRMLLAELKKKKETEASHLKLFFMKTIRPTNPLLLFWNFVKMLVILHTVFSFPMQDSFGETFIFVECQYLGDTIVVEFAILIFDIMLNFNIETYWNGDLIKDKRLIAKRYFQDHFLTDSLSLVGFISNRHIFFFSQGKCATESTWILLFVKYLFFFKLKQINKFLNAISSELDQKGRYNSYLNLIKLFFQIMMLAHLIACVWIKVSRFSSPIYHKGWLLSRQLENSPDWLLIYAQAMYFACMTMTTVGYGDILPENTVEYFVCIIIMLISCGFFAYSLNTITYMLSDLNKSKVEYKRQSDLLTNYMSKKFIDKSLQKRVKNYLKSMYKSGLSDQINQEQQAVEMLSVQLKNELNFSDKGKMIMQIEIFNRLFSLGLITQLTQRVQEHSYSPQEMIPQGLGNVIFVFSGEVEVIFERKIENQVVNKVLFTLQRGEYFGLKNLFGMQDHCLIKSKDFTIIYTINQNDLLDSFSHKSVLPEDYEKYCMVRDHVLLQGETQELHLKCKACKLNGHDFFECPQLFFIPNHVYVIQKHNFNHTNERVNHTRRMGKLNCLLNSSRLKEVAQAFHLSDSCETSSHSDMTLRTDNVLQLIKEEDEDELDRLIQEQLEKGISLQPDSEHSWQVPDSTEQDRMVHPKTRVMNLKVKAPQNNSTPQNKFKQRQSVRINPEHMASTAQSRRASLAAWKQMIEDNNNDSEDEQQKHIHNSRRRKSKQTLDRRKSRQTHLDRSAILNALAKQSSSHREIPQRQIENNIEARLSTVVYAEYLVSFDLDCGKQWSFYNPQNNLVEVIKGYNKIVQKQRKHLKKTRQQKKLRTLLVDKSVKL